ncbi:MAG: hypothetical protein AAGU75_22860, partial [Bacillota bacterium]
LHLWLQYVLEPDLGWSLHIILDDQTTAQELREAWGDIDAARHHMIKDRGSDPQLFSAMLMDDLCKSHQKGVSYQKLAYDLNFDALVYMLWGTDERQDDRNRKGAIICFLNQMSGLGMKKDEIAYWEQEARGKLVRGLLPWDPLDYPVDRDRVRNALRSFISQKMQNQIVIKSDSNYLERIRTICYMYGYWSDANQMLKDQSRDFVGIYAPRLEKRINQIQVNLRTIPA